MIGELQPNCLDSIIELPSLIESVAISIDIFVGLLSVLSSKRGRISPSQSRLSDITILCSLLTVIVQLCDFEAYSASR